MHVRVNTVTGATAIDAGIVALRETAVPELLGARGFRGLTASGNYQTGEVGILGMWDTLEDLEASDSAVAKLRRQTMDKLGGSIATRVMEEVVNEVVGAPPAVGSPLRIVSVQMDPARIDEQLRNFKEEVLPELRATPGLRAVRNMVDRFTGEGIVGTIWWDTAAMRASEARSAERREDARARGVQVSEPRYREVLFMHLV